MHTPTNRLSPGVLIAVTALAAAWPAYAASPALWPIPMPFAGPSMTGNNWILTGSLALLAAALALRLMRRGPRETAADGPDLRWWRNP